MSDVIRQYPYVSPNTMRKKLHMDEHLFQGYVPKAFERTHVNDTKYISNIQNWGSEHLLETRKMKLLKPPMQDIYVIEQDHGYYSGDEQPIVGDIFRKYFDIVYDDNANTYLQENTIACKLKKDVLHDQKVYLIFEDVERVHIPRTMYENGTWVFPHVAWKTSTPPTLFIEEFPGVDDAGGSGYRRTSGHALYQLRLKYHSKDLTEDEDATYWFMSTIPREPISPVASDYQELQPSQLILLDPDHCTDSKIQTIPFDTWMEEQPLLWITFDHLRTLPKFEMENNIGWHDWSILSPGTNDKGDHYLYAFAYGKENLPSEPEHHPLHGQDTECEFQIRVYPLFGEFLPIEEENLTPEEVTRRKLENQNMEIGRIEFIQYLFDDRYPDEVVNKRHVITFDSSNARLRFFQSNNQYDQFRYNRWNFRRPKPGHWDYDGTTFVNRTYGYLNNFALFYNENYNYYGQLPPVFRLIPSYTKWNQYNWLRNNGVIGIHIDQASDYSQNNVTKKNGTIHELGDFDGLPPYYQYRLPRDIARAHQELYAMKDQIQSFSRNVTEKRVAGLLVDAAVPQNKTQDMLLDMDPAIVYDKTTQYPTYITIEDNVMSQNNVVSDICFIDRSTFEDATITTQSPKQRFVYHGNRTFSLGIIGFDPILETGRVYYVSNDIGEYENNDTILSPKPPRTLARICDIPTDYDQLISIKYVAPTILIDEYYVRTEYPYLEEDQNRVWRLINDGVFVYTDDHQYIFDNTIDLNTELSLDYLRNHGFCEVKWLNNTIVMKKGLMLPSDANEFYWSIIDGGVGYSVGDIIQAYVAGHALKGEVYNVDDDGCITEIGYQESGVSSSEIPFIVVPVKNFNDRYNTFECKTISRTKHGSISDGCYLRLTIDINIWQTSMHSGTAIDEMYTWNPIPNLYTFQFDESGNIWLCTLVENTNTDEVEALAIQLFKESGRIRDQLPGETDIEYEAFVMQTWNNSIAYRREFIARATWSWQFTCLLTGNQVYDNPYDDHETWNKRQVTNILIQNLAQTILPYRYPEDMTTYGNTDHQEMYVCETHEFLRENVIDDTTLLEYMTQHPTAKREDVIMQAFQSKLKPYQLIKENCNFTTELMTKKDSEQIDREYILMNVYRESTLPIRQSLYPAQHLVSQISTGHLPTRLSFGNLDQVEKLQPTVFLYHPFQKSYNTYDVSQYNDAQILEHYQSTITEYPIDIWKQQGIYLVCTKYFWKYKGYQSSSDYSLERIEKLALQLLREDYPIREIETDEEYEERIQEYWDTPSMQETYVDRAARILLRTTYHPNIFDEPTPCELVAKPGEPITKTNNQEIIEMIDGPKGGTKVISTRQYFTHYETASHKSYNTSLFYFFQLPDDATLDGFKMKDAFTDIDISNRCIILYQSRLFYYNTNTLKWTLLRKGNNLNDQ